MIRSLRFLPVIMFAVALTGCGSDGGGGDSGSGSGSGSGGTTATKTAVPLATTDSVNASNLGTEIPDGGTVPSTATTLVVAQTIDFRASDFTSTSSSNFPYSAIQLVTTTVYPIVGGVRQSGVVVVSAGLPWISNFHRSLSNSYTFGFFRQSLLVQTYIKVSDFRSAFPGVNVFEIESVVDQDGSKYLWRVEGTTTTAPASARTNVVTLNFLASSG